MCGIFGVSNKLTDSPSDNLKLFSKDLKTLTQISEQRGSDTFGFVIKNDKNNFLYKINQKPSEALSRADLKNFLINKLNHNKIDSISIIGQTRLVTNGSKFSIENNQPLKTNNAIGVHNGIFVNIELDKASTITKKYESFYERSDSLKFYEKISELVNRKDFIHNYLELLKNLRGNYSLAFFLKDYQEIFLSSNCGSLYYYYDQTKDFFAFASEKNILSKYIKKSALFKKNKSTFNGSLITQCFNKTIIFNPKKNQLTIFNHALENIEIKEKNYSLENKIESNISSNVDEDMDRFVKIKRCSKCILPITYPFITFDKNGVCNYCLDYKKQVFLGDNKLNELLDKYRSKNNEPDCLVGLSGGRDSCYGLHILKTKYKMNPIAYTYDWGLTTDIARINASKVCGKLGIEHIIRSPDIEKKRSYVRKNILAWLKKPKLGMLPIVHVGDKKFFDYGRILSKELNLKLVVHCTGVQLEQREFFLGFAGIKQKLTNNQKMYSYSLLNKIKMFYWYSLQFILNPSYINSALLDNLDGFLASFIRKDNFLQLYNYERWDEDKITKTLNEEYEWKDDISYGKNQWRMGDGQTAFNNFVYFTLAGFSEFDQFRSNQIREGLIERKEALRLCEEDNKIKYDTLKIFSEIVGFNLDYILSKISCIPKLY